MSDAIAAKLRETYSRQAAAFDQQRDTSLFEKPWLDAFLAHVPAGGHLLDLGCGTGAPIAGYLLDAGRQVKGVDVAPPMLAIARKRFPQGRWVLGDLRRLDLKGAFDGVLAWNSLFHLPASEQEEALPRLCRLLRPEAPLMLTIGPELGEATGHVAGEDVYHASLAPETYRAILAANGCAIAHMVIEDAACHGHSVVLAVKARA